MLTAEHTATDFQSFEEEEEKPIFSIDLIKVSADLCSPKIQENSSDSSMHLYMYKNKKKMFHNFRSATPNISFTSKRSCLIDELREFEQGQISAEKIFMFQDMQSFKNEQNLKMNSVFNRKPRERH